MVIINVLINAKVLKFKMNQRDVLVNVQANMPSQNFLLIKLFVIIHANFIKPLIKNIVFQHVMIIIQFKLLMNHKEKNALHHAN